jgi:hypothetical protein
MKKNDEDFPKWLFIQGILDGTILQPCLWFHAEQESKNAFPQTNKKKKNCIFKIGSISDKRKPANTYYNYQMSINGTSIKECQSECITVIRIT